MVQTNLFDFYLYWINVKQCSRANITNSSDKNQTHPSSLKIWKYLSLVEPVTPIFWIQVTYYCAVRPRWIIHRLSSHLLAGFLNIFTYNPHKEYFRELKKHRKMSLFSLPAQKIILHAVTFTNAFWYVKIYQFSTSAWLW